MIFRKLIHKKAFNRFDYTNLNTSCVAYFSGNWNNDTNAGTFHLNVNNTASNSNANITAHLMFYYFLISRLSPLRYTVSVTLPLGKT